ncbi:uncharacterized protein B0I36DRAFT_369052 [Microdochium trichocladiopsis]|uniref:Uncharacterized protein n=1 Tax=Microdochium trichocladiopsis TaxID=1682393 RepID=A0A9P9BJZ8_9PEZI|nr:uncharacterized protein B0I36DRAFT_369052 [Microdochium trichocladiopsis]KAH7016554.1 hypothetical protein B0I36DRAFT_369052 [Microdochium trichocladiopsis]
MPWLTLVEAVKAQLEDDELRPPAAFTLLGQIQTELQKLDPNIRQISKKKMLQFEAVAIDEFKRSMLWYETSWSDSRPCAIEVFHDDGFTFGQSLQPLLKPIYGIRHLVAMMHEHESYRQRGGSIAYTVRYKFIRKLLRRDPNARMELFKSSESVLNLVKKQMRAHLKAEKQKPGWRQAMRDAGIWDDDVIKPPKFSQHGTKLELLEG